MCYRPLDSTEKLVEEMCTGCYRVHIQGQWQSAHWWNQPWWQNRPLAEIPRPGKCVRCGQKLSELEKTSGITCGLCRKKLIKRKKQTAEPSKRRETAVEELRTDPQEIIQIGTIMAQTYECLLAAAQESEEIDGWLEIAESPAKILQRDNPEITEKQAYTNLKNLSRHNSGILKKTEKGQWFIRTGIEIQVKTKSAPQKISQSILAELPVFDWNATVIFELAFDQGKLRSAEELKSLAEALLSFRNILITIAEADQNTREIWEKFLTAWR